MNAPVCNIGTQGQTIRRKGGTILLVLAGVVSGYMIATRAPWEARLLVFPLFAGGFLMLLESTLKVCVRLAFQKKVNEA